MVVISAFGVDGSISHVESSESRALTDSLLQHGFFSVISCLFSIVVALAAPAFSELRLLLPRSDSAAFISIAAGHTNFFADAMLITQCANLFIHAPSRLRIPSRETPLRHFNKQGASRFSSESRDILDVRVLGHVFNKDCGVLMPVGECVMTAFLMDCCMQTISLPHLRTSQNASSSKRHIQISVSSAEWPSSQITTSVKPAYPRPTSTIVPPASSRTTRAKGL